MISLSKFIMKKKPQRLLIKIGFLLCFLPVVSFAQNHSTRWSDYFSYSNVSNIIETNGFIFCSAENGLFTYDLNGGEVEKISKVTDLNDVDITAFDYSEETELLMVGYRSGEMDMIGPDEIHNMLEIPLHQAYTGSKIVNHISSAGPVAVIAGEFGLASFDLENFEFMETCYFVQTGVYFGVKETAILDGWIYAASDQGIFIHELDEFIANFVSWTQPQGVPTQAFQKIQAFNGNLLAAAGDTVYRFDGDNWTVFGQFPGLRDISVHENTLSITRDHSVTNYDEALNMQETVSFFEELNTGLKVNGITYGGSRFAGLLSGTNSIMPDGPYNNLSFSVTTLGDEIWIAPGGWINFNNVQQNKDGYYHFDGTRWIHVQSVDMLGVMDVVDLEVNPSDPSQVFVSSWNENSWTDPGAEIGLIEMKNDQFVVNYNQFNSGMQFRERTGGSVFDEEGNLWIGQSYVDTPSGKTYMVKKTGSNSWSNFNLQAAGGDAGATKPFIYNGYAFMALPRSNSGLKITNMSEVFTIDSSSNRGGLPSSEVASAAVDLNGVLWIGTILGLRVVYDPINTVQNEPFQSFPIIIEQNGIPEALLTDVQINTIQVDGANGKWVGTETGGAYYFSEDGEETIYHFTSGNSPLPSNKVNNIRVNRLSGEVFFATDKGLVSFRSDAVEVGESFGDVYTYPNPVRPGFQGEVTVKGLPNDADVKITDIVGNLIFQTKASGGVAKWDTRNMKGKYVASGVYIVLLANRDGSETRQTKIAIVR